MWLIVGIDKITKRLVEIAIAMCDAERRIILRQEARNYDNLQSVRL